MKSFIAIGVTFALVIVALGASVEAQNDNGKFLIRVRGADSLARRIDGLSKIFMKENPGVTVTVSGGSRATGFEGLLDGTSEVGMAPRRISEKERQTARGQGLELNEHLIGYGGIVFVTHPGNSVNELSVDQVAKIFRGDISNWAEVGGPNEPITAFTISEMHSGTLTFMETDILKGHMSAKVKAVNFFPTVIKSVSETPGSIGFTRVRDAFETTGVDKSSFKVLNIKKDANSPAVAPSRENIGDGSYAVRRPWFLYTAGKSSPEVKKFVDFILLKGWGKQQI